jgi:hypothetical protein
LLLVTPCAPISDLSLLAFLIEAPSPEAIFNGIEF